MQQYTLGFVFVTDSYESFPHSVYLIEKQAPAWQQGYLNGIGGKREDTDYNHLFAMRREFREEAKADIIDNKWTYYITLSDGDVFNIAGYYTIITPNEYIIETNTNEKVVLVTLSDLFSDKLKVIPNLPWLVAMALSHSKERAMNLKRNSYTIIN